jgi:hypothetical protein
MQQIKLMSKLGLTLVAITALSVAIATQAYNIQAADAQAKLPNNSVRSETIVDGQVKTADLANNAVTTGKIADGTIQEDDIADDVIPDGGGAIQLSVQIVTESIQIAPNTESGIAVDCPSGTILTGGGFSHFGAGSQLHIIQSIPVDENTWQVFGENQNTAATFSLGAYALCIDPTP